MVWWIGSLLAGEMVVVRGWFELSGEKVVYGGNTVVRMNGGWWNGW